MSRKNNSTKANKSTDKTPIYVAIIGLIGTIIVALIGIVNTRTQVLLPVSLTQTANVQISTPPLPISTNTTDGINPVPNPSTVSSIPANTPQLATCSAVLDFGVWIHCGIKTPGEIHTITFEADQDDYIYIRLINKDQGELFSPRTTIYDPSGTKLSEDYSNGGAERVVRLPSSGTYAIRIEDGERAHTGEFALYTQSLNNLTSAATITPGLQLYGSFTTAFQEDAYRFDATAGEKVSIDVSEVPITGPLTLRIIIYGPNGNQEYEDIGSAGVSILFTASKSGTYVMFVSNPALNETGEYFVLRQ